ncbi:hypothetical protein GCM10020229_61120 [Kitasatospora albolonga]|uniref:hypothetical protein n=1 Tax=Kitasatospora albolonga TaxID=68173 RepID=UPI0031EFAEC9
MTTEELTDHQDPGRAAGLTAALTELAAAVHPGPVPAAAVLAGGRRRLRRRRAALTGAAALAMAAVVGGAAVLTAPRTVAPAGTTSAPSSYAPAPARDPFAPVRVLLAEGIGGGGGGARSWQAWAALWPQAPKTDALRQYRAIWEDQGRPARPGAAEPDAAFVEEHWRPGTDVLNLYLTVDGRRQAEDIRLSLPAPGGPAGQGETPTGELGSITDGPVLLALLPVGPEVAKVTAGTPGATGWEVQPLTVGDSPIRWVAAVKLPGKPLTLRTWDTAGTLLATHNRAA